jgi:orotate phosphoribosyltransferase
VSESPAAEIMLGLYERGMLRTWYRHRPEGWTLVSGQWSPLYLQLRELCSHPDLLRLTGEALAEKVAAIGPIDRLVGVAYAGIPIAIATSLAAGVPCLMTRKITGSQEEAVTELKRYGQHALVEGEMSSGDRLGLVDDLVTRFDSKLEAARNVNDEAKRRELFDVTCRDVFVVIDREEGGAQTASALGFSLHALIRLSEGIELLRPMLDGVEYDVITAYLRDPRGFQDAAVRAELRRAVPAGQSLT